MYPNGCPCGTGCRHKKGLMDSIKTNEEYRKTQLERLAELEKEGMQLVESVGAKQMKAERQRVLHLTVERCALELQNLELELRERSLQREVEDRNCQLQYYMGLLQKHGINFTRYEKLGFSAQRRYQSMHLAVAAFVDLRGGVVDLLVLLPFLVASHVLGLTG